MSAAKRVRLVRIAGILALIVGTFAFAGAASAAGSSGPGRFKAAAQECVNNDDASCDDLDDYGIGCINGDIVGDVDGTAINCDVDGDVGDTGINGDVTGNVGNCINGDVGSTSGSSINCDTPDDAAPAPQPQPQPQPSQQPAPKPQAPGASGPTAITVAALPSTGSDQAALVGEKSTLLLVLAAVGLTALAGVSSGRREA